MVLDTRSNPWRNDTSQVETAHEFGVTTWRDEYRKSQSLDHKCIPTTDACNPDFFRIGSGETWKGW
jgi:hypothetical protein